MGYTVGVVDSRHTRSNSKNCIEFAVVHIVRVILIEVPPFVCAAGLQFFMIV